MWTQDPLRAAPTGLKVLGRAQGFLAYRQVNDRLPSEIVDPECIEGLVDDMLDAGIPVLEELPRCSQA